MILLLKQPPLGDVVQLAVAVKRGSTSPTEYDGRISFGGQPGEKASILLYGPPGQEYRFYSTNIPTARLAAASTAKSVRVYAPGFDETFVLTDMGDLLKVMGSCASDLA